MVKDKNFYNAASAAKLGWAPEWFGAQEFDSKLVKSIKEFQKNSALSVDGLCGPMTYRRIYTERQAQAELAILAMEEKVNGLDEIQKPEKFIICNGNEIPIAWDKMVDIYEPGGMILEPYKAVNEGARFVNKFVIHWDSALSSKSCHSILKKRNLGAQFSIDNDGTLYQFGDANDIYSHAPPGNYLSIGVEISNAVHPKYKEYYIRKGYGARPNIKCPKINKKYYFNHILGFYPVQIEALIQLIKAVRSFYPDIALQTPPEMGLCRKTRKELLEYSGIVSHYHMDLDKQKWDCAGLDIGKEVLPFL